MFSSILNHFSGIIIKWSRGILRLCLLSNRSYHRALSTEKRMDCYTLYVDVMLPDASAPKTLQTKKKVDIT